MKTELEEAAEKFYPPKTTDLICSPKLVRDSFIAGAKSDAAKDYWFNIFKQKFIVILNGN